ncbi:MAG: hypothetical protein KDB88_08240 [Flavobacteriales bacterium]|nr:hypothetical protein [Flavobacteriales bacterium]
MENLLKHYLLILAVLLGGALIAQPDGDHPTTDGAGFSYLQPDANVGIGINPYNFTIGLTPSNFATLRVRGDQLGVNSAAFGGLCTFRTDVASATEQGWEMWRDVNHIGRIWHYGGNGPSPGGHRAFHVQSMEERDAAQDRYSGVFLMNDDDDGCWFIHNGAPTGSRAFPDPTLQVLDRVGYGALGFRDNYMNTGSTRPRGPWSRWHLFHDAIGTRPFFAFRSQMQNGMTMTGNSDLAYIGQWYDQGTNGTGTEVDDNSNLVIASSDDALPAGTGHHWDNISFRFMGDMAGSQGSASGVEGLEMMRIRPYRATTNDPIEGFVGIGDFLGSSAGPISRGS